MLSRRLLASFVVFLWYTTPSLAQLPKQCPPDVLLVKDIGELSASEAKVYVHVIQVKFDPDSQIPVDIQEEIAKNETGKTHEVKADSDYLQNVAKEIADEGAGELLRSHGYLQALTYAELEVLKTKGVDVDVAANVGAEPERQFRSEK